MFVFRIAATFVRAALMATMATMMMVLVVMHSMLGQGCLVD